MSAVDFGIVDYPSDDPRTPIVNDPTRDVVGNVPLLFATKQAELLIDQSSPGIVDPGDTLRYTITIYNNGAIPATNVVLADNVPPNTTYVANSTTLNGLPYRAAGQRLVAARRPVSTSARPIARRRCRHGGRGHALAEFERGRHVRSARERRRRRPARSSATRQSCARRRCRTC